MEKLTEASKSIHLVSEDTVKLALHHFSTVMSQPTFDIDSLIEMKIGRDGKTPVMLVQETLYSTGFRRFYTDPRSATGKVVSRNESTKSYVVHTTTPTFQRENHPHTSFGKISPQRISHAKRRKLARTMAETHGVDEGWMMYGISVALRMIECLLCDGHVIVIPNRGRFVARNISADYPSVDSWILNIAKNDVRIVVSSLRRLWFQIQASSEVITYTI